jgi:hypothetical protein
VPGEAPPLALRSEAGRRQVGYTRRRPEESVLYGVVREEIETFLLRARERERPAPRFVERELRTYLECGILAHGFVRVRCDACGCDRLVAFSCKGRGFCPSCGGRRMADTAAHLVDRVFPETPVRQWVLSLPFALRYRLGYDARLTEDVLQLFVRAIFASLRRRARRKWGVHRAQCGAVTFVQRFGDALNLNVHFHSLVIDGVYGGDDKEALRFYALPPPTDAEVGRVAGRVARRLARLLERRGLGPGADPAEADSLPERQPLLAALYAASVQGRVATGPRAGRRVLRLGDRIEAEDLPFSEGERCASVAGVSLHANVAVPARDRARLERLCRYTARPPVATERLSRLPDGRLLYRLRRRWRDGTTHLVFAPLELVEKLAALIPPPRFHLVRYHGVLAPRARSRRRVVPGGASPSPEADLQRCASHGARPGEAAGAATQVPRGGGRVGAQPMATPLQASSASRLGDGSASPHAANVGPETVASRSGQEAGGPPPRSRRYTWAELMRRVFALDVLECPRCGGPMRILAEIHPPDATRAILEWLKLPSRAPPTTAAVPEAEPLAHPDFEFDTAADG